MIMHDPFGAQEPRSVSTDGKMFGIRGPDVWRYLREISAAVF